jgi:ferrochelatase
MKLKQDSGILLMNLGTPSGDGLEDVTRYLKEFLMDEHVIDMPFLLRYLLVNGIIIPRRAHKSAALYQALMQNGSSPLLSHMRSLADKMQQRLRSSHIQVEIGMRYGNPSLTQALQKLLAGSVSQIIIMPLYPQQTKSTTESAHAACRQILARLQPQIPIMIVPAYYHDELYTTLLARQLKTVLADHAPEKVIFSYHNIPRSHLPRICQKKCENAHTACHHEHFAERACYQSQCFATTRAVVAKAGLGSDQVVTAFQSKIGSEKRWLAPITSRTIASYAQKGIKDILVICPGFSCDCLETLHEIKVQEREKFMAQGGRSLELVPALNSEEQWMEALIQIMAARAQPFVWQ